MRLKTYMEQIRPIHTWSFFGCFFSLVFFWPFFSTAFADELMNNRAEKDRPIVSDIIIQIHGDIQDPAKWIEMARNLIFIKPKDHFSPERLQQSINAIKLSKQFRKIDVDEKQEEDGKIILIFNLTLFRLIKDIKIKGAYPLFERDILKVMTIYVGDVYNKESLSKHEDLVAGLYHDEGFVGSNVKVAAKQDPKDKNYIIYMTIEKKEYLTLKEIEITGNRGLSDTRLKSIMGIWWSSLIPGSAGRYNKVRFQQDIKKITQFYISHRYPDASVEFTVEDDPATKSVSVRLIIDEGPFYDVRFTGNKGIRSLKKDLILFKQGNKRDIGLRRSVQRIRKRYQDAGYPDTQITTQSSITEEKNRTIRKVMLVIDEGPKTLVDSIQIEGNNFFTEKRIKKSMLTSVPGRFRSKGFVPETFEQDMLAIETLYIKEGFMGIQIDKTLTWSPDREQVSVKLKIDEGNRIVVDRVTISGINTVSQDEVDTKIELKKGEPFREYMMQSDENAISALISKKGYPYVRVKGDFSLDKSKAKVDIGYHVDEGPYVELKKVYFTGNFKTRERTLQRELNLVEQGPFSAESLLQGQKDIHDMDIFKTVHFKAIGLKEKADKINLFVEVEEKKPYFIQAGVGHETQSGLFAKAKIGDRNLFGLNKNVWLSSETSEIGYYTEMGISEPRFFSTQIAASLVLFTEREAEFNQDFETLRSGATLGFSRKLTKKSIAGLSFSYEEKKKYEKDLQAGAWAVLSENERERRYILVTTPSIVYDGRDSFVQPKKGFFSSLYIDISDGSGDGLDDFIKYRFDFRVFYTPFDRITFAWLSRFGYIDDLNRDNDIPDDQLFFLGGSSDVRGFDENMLRYSQDKDPIGGRESIVESIEARLAVMRNFELSLFFDTGRIYKTYEEDDIKEFRSSAGVGLRYLTPVGPIGFCYGFKLDRKPDESSGRLHLSIGYTF